MAMRQLGERNFDRAISQLLWSPKMDILAVVNETNEVSLFRLNWQKVSGTQKVNAETIFCTMLLSMNLVSRFGPRRVQKTRSVAPHGAQMARFLRLPTKVAEYLCLTWKAVPLYCPTRWLVVVSHLSGGPPVPILCRTKNSKTVRKVFRMILGIFSSSSRLWAKPLATTLPHKRIFKPVTNYQQKAVLPFYWLEQRLGKDLSFSLVT